MVRLPGASISGASAVVAMAVVFAGATRIANAAQAPDKERPSESIRIDWNSVVRVSTTTPTLQAVVTPLMGPESPLHEQVWKALKDLDARYVRYVPWLPYPRLAVAELEPPTEKSNSWDFSLIDPYTTQFFKANQGRPAIVNFSTIPQWMFKTEHPVTYPSDPNLPVWNYTQGTELRDPTLKELGDYYARLIGWYTKGGFSDEQGHRHPSQHHFAIDYWEVLNEPDLEHQTTPEQYTERYDAIVQAIRTVQPGMKFVGLALADPSREPEYFEYFLNPKNHKPGIPLDMISYHFYATPNPGQDLDSWQYTTFDQADRFVRAVRYIDSIRRRLSPATKTTINEVGIIAPQDSEQGEPGYTFKPFPDWYWNLSAAEFAYLYGELSKLGIDAVGESALMQLPGFYPSVTMMDWKSGNPNPRYWVLKMLIDSISLGDKLVKTDVTGHDVGVYAEGFVTAGGKRKVLLVNTRNRNVEVQIPGSAGGVAQCVDQATGDAPPRSTSQKSDAWALGGFAVSIVTLP